MKSALNSLTIRGAVLAAVPIIVMALRAMGMEITAKEIEDLVSAIFGVFGLILVIIGRWRARGPLVGVFTGTGGGE